MAEVIADFGPRPTGTSGTLQRKELFSERIQLLPESFRLVHPLRTLAPEKLRVFQERSRKECKRLRQFITMASCLFVLLTVITTQHAQAQGAPPATSSDPNSAITNSQRDVPAN